LRNTNSLVKIYSATFIFILLSSIHALSENSSILLQKGWEELTRDNDTTAFKLFNQAYEIAKTEKDIQNIATALLDMGICSYGSSYTLGLHYCLLAMDEFKKLENSNPQNALIGRCKCLQLISTIKSRQGKFRETISLSKEAMQGFSTEKDTSGYLGLIYNSLGNAYSNINMLDSSEYFHRLALQERLLTGKYIYLPGSYIKVADIELKKGNKEQSRNYYENAFHIADSMGNRQSIVSSLIGIGNWHLYFNKNEKEAEENFLKAKHIASYLSDKSFYLKTLTQLLNLKKKQGKFSEALTYSEEMDRLKDTLASWEKEKITKSLEVQFDVSEKENQLTIVQKEKNIATLTNYILWGTIGFLILTAVGIILFLRKINRRDKILLSTQKELQRISEERKRLKELQMQNEIEFKESQLSVMAIQMLQKNELMNELKEKLETENHSSKDNLQKIISKGLNHDKEWDDFNKYFESINKNFYEKLQTAYPEISPNDLKICALIKLNLSIKEMASILNISPDSVKTARYRLRKKLQLKTEDNLTDFIFNLKE
jgi:DNA-binding CsgD family transcriptional regulator